MRNTNTNGNRVRNPIVRLARAIRNLIRRRGLARIQGYTITTENIRTERARLNRMIALGVGGANENNVAPAAYLAANATEIIVLPNVTLYLPRQGRNGQAPQYMVYTGQELTQQNGNGNQNRNQNQNGNGNQNQNQNRNQNQNGNGNQNQNGNGNQNQNRNQNNGNGGQNGNNGQGGQNGNNGQNQNQNQNGNGQAAQNANANATA